MGYSSAQRRVFLALLAAIAAGAAFATVSLAGVSQPERPVGSPVVFLEGVVRQIAGNHYARAWQTLAPAQQRLVSEREYVRCESASPIPGRLTSLEVVRAFDEPVAVPGASATVSAKAVTFRLEITDAALRESVVVTHTVHAVPAGTRWAWILPPERFQLHRSGACGATPVTAQR
jgi:hypothetical protein